MNIQTSKQGNTNIMSFDKSLMTIDDHQDHMDIILKDIYGITHRCEADTIDAIVKCTHKRFIEHNNLIKRDLFTYLSTAYEKTTFKEYLLEKYGTSNFTIDGEVKPYYANKNKEENMSIETTFKAENLHFSEACDLSLEVRVHHFNEFAKGWEQSLLEFREKLSSKDYIGIDESLKFTFFNPMMDINENQNFFHEYICDFIFPELAHEDWHLPISIYLKNDGCKFDIKKRLFKSCREDRTVWVPFSEELFEYWLSN